MDWVYSLSIAIKFIESNLANAISVEDVSNEIYVSSSYFQRIFNLITGVTIGSYIRNRRLSLAGQEILYTKNELEDIAFKYQYENLESFSKAFTRFHGVTPSAARKEKLNVKVFHPLNIIITIQGGFEMTQKIINDEWMAEHEKVLAKIAEHIKSKPEDDVKIIQGALYTSLLTPDEDGLYCTSLMEAITKLRANLKNEINVDLPIIRFIDNKYVSDGIVSDNEIAISINKEIVWKIEVNAANIEACDTAIVNELEKIMRNRK